MSDEKIVGFEIPEGHKSGIVTLVGRPNVGKSTLMNAFMQQKIAIVTPRPQTTRVRQLGILTDPQFQMIFVDTPGLMKPRHKLDEFMVETAVETLEDADVILWLVDASEPVGYGDQAIAQQLTGLGTGTPIILAMNKSDLLSAEEVMPRTEEYCALLPDAAWILFSATQGNGRDELFQMLVDALPEGPRYYPPEQITDIFVRDIAGELVREQIMLQMREEIPYGVAVQVNEFKERENGTIYMNATILTERNSHKQIIIGAKGKQLKELGAAARQEIEELVGGKVFLELWVKVQPKWRRDEKSLKRLGYSITGTSG
ncbi:MAG: GTPase Era [Ardenticatenaceae bacterium]|nr:GTPase Era [Anaerolineales bacterium]MCB8922876.1 GTPase Era [Ardenticatenaceae bacterium]MCB8990386.1 GTPase Era [Ardenticatenaceae bacterium]